jgi:prophage antirepressor-like protein
MNELQRVFEYGDKQIRTDLRDGEPIFCGKDICEIIDVTTEQMRRLDEDEKVLHLTQTPGGQQEMIFVTEAGVYTLILGSRKAEAKQFKRWVTHEILPAIRKHGIYATDQTVDKILADPDFGIQLLTKYKEERIKRLQAEQTNAILMHVNKTYTATEIAKELGFTSAIALNNYLHKNRIQYKLNATWVLYSDYANKGYVELKQEVLNGRAVYHRRFTQLGREFLLKLIQPKGV